MNIPQSACQRIRRATSGFTLVEVLVAAALMGSLMTIISSIVASSLDVQQESRATAAVAEDGRFILSRLDYDMQRASAVTMPASLGASADSLELDIGGQPHSYTVVGDRLELDNGTDSLPLNSSETTISNVNFERLGNPGGVDTVRLSFELTSAAQTDQGTESQVFSTTFGRRQ